MVWWAEVLMRTATSDDSAPTLDPGGIQQFLPEALYMPSRGQARKIDTFSSLLCEG